MGSSPGSEQDGRLGPPGTEMEINDMKNAPRGVSSVDTTGREGEMPNRAVAPAGDQNRREGRSGTRTRTRPPPRSRGQGFAQKTSSMLPSERLHQTTARQALIAGIFFF